MKPIELRCEYAQCPLGIDITNPRLSWKLADARRNAAQSAYRVLVASSEELLARDEADYWDSERIESSDTTWIRYGGDP